MDMENLISELSTRNTKEERIKFLCNFYPCLGVYVLKKKPLRNVLELYTQRCKMLEGDCHEYSYYVHGFLFPWFLE